MHNALYRTQNIEDIAGVPAVPGRGAYSYTTKGSTEKFVCDVWAEGSQSTDYDDKSRRCEKGHVEKVETTETVNVPATPGSPAIPGRIVLSPEKGWNSRAVSLPSFESLGYAEFSVPSNATGVAAGLVAEMPPADFVGYEYIPHGVFFTDNKAYSISTGEALGNYAGADVWKVMAVRGAVEIYRNGTLKTTEPTDVYTGRTVRLSASIYWIDGYVFDPRVVSENSAAINGAFPRLTGKLWADNHAELIGAMPKMRGQLVMVSGIFGSFPRMQGKIWADNHAELIGSLPKMQGQLSAGRPVVVERAYIMGMMPKMSGALTAEKPYEAQLWATMPKLRGQLIAGNQGVIYGQMPKLRGRLVARPAGTMNLQALAMAASDIDPFTTKLIRLATQARIESALTAQQLLELLLAESGAVSDDLTVEGIAELLIAAIAKIGAQPRVDDASETWVYGTQTNTTTRYTFGCNSFAKIGDRYYGASSDGIHLLEGDTDAGQPINAVVGFGTPDFGTSALKGMTNCYVGMSAKGHLYLKVTANGTTFIYRTRGFDQLMKEQRIDTGRGLRSTVFGLELVNEGADFELDSIEFRVVPMNRRIQS